MIAPAGLLANLDQRFLRLRLGNVAVVRDRNVSRGRRQRSKCFNWHNKKFFSATSKLARPSFLFPWRKPVIGLLTCCPLTFQPSGAVKLSDLKTFASDFLNFLGGLIEGFWKRVLLSMFGRNRGVVGLILEQF